MARRDSRRRGDARAEGSTDALPPIGPEGLGATPQGVRNADRGIEPVPGTDPVRPRLGALPCLVVILALASCQVPAATVQQGLDYGFRTPKQAFASWRTALQADLLAEEHACFSEGWKAANGASTLTAYGAARDVVLGEIPRLRWALSRAEAPEVLWASDDRVWLQSRVPGPAWVRDRYLTLKMRREYYWELYDAADPQLAVAGGYCDPDPRATGHFEYVKSMPRSTAPGRRGGHGLVDEFHGVVRDFDDVTDGIAPEAITDLHIGFRWKIDDLVVSDEPLPVPKP